MKDIVPWQAPQNHVINNGSMRLTYTIYDSPNPACTTCLFMCHATGSCRQIWEPVLEELALLYTSNTVPIIVCTDARGHGESPLDSNSVISWDCFTTDALAVIRAIPIVLNKPDLTVHGIGHSMGGCTLVLAALVKPIFRTLLLIEPILFSGPRRRMPENTLSGMAMRRMYTFSTIEDARLRYAKNATFTKWDARTLDSYIRGGLRLGPDRRYYLKCLPEIEAEVYRCGSDNDAWQRLPELTHLITKIVLAGGEKSYIYTPKHQKAVYSRMCEAMTSSTCVTNVRINDTGHFLVMEQPATVAKLVYDCIRIYPSSRI